MYQLFYMQLMLFCQSTYSAGSVSDMLDNEALLTSFACQWKVLNKHKDCTLPLSKIVFKKHLYGSERKILLKIMEELDPGPVKYRNTAKDLLKEFLGKVKGKGFGVSLATS